MSLSRRICMIGVHPVRSIGLATVAPCRSVTLRSHRNRYVLVTPATRMRFASSRQLRPNVLRVIT